MPALSSVNGTWVGAAGSTASSRTTRPSWRIVTGMPVRAPPAGSRVVDAQLEDLRLADDAEARRAQDRQLAVALVGAAGEQDVQGCGQVERRGVGRGVVGLAVGQRDDGTQPGTVAAAQALAQAAEQAAALAALTLEAELAQLDPGHAPDPLAQGGLGLGELGRALAQALAGRAVGEQDDEIVEGCAFLAAQDRVDQEQKREGEEHGAPDDTARPAPEGDRRRAPGQDPAAQRPPGRCGAKTRLRRSLAEALQEGRDMDLVGLVVAGQRVHGEIDAEAAGHLALRLTARDRQTAARRRRPRPRHRPIRWRRR